jgi:hypothetical protein
MIALVAALAVTAGGLGLSLTGAFDDDGVIAQSNTATGFMMGHLIVEAHDDGGDLIAYRQTDNEVVDRGEQCILKMLFATTDSTAGRGGYASTGTDGTGGGACTGVLTGAWDVIGIGTDNDNGAWATGQSVAVQDALVVLGNETATTKGLERGTATTKTWTNGTGATTTKLVLSKTFTFEGEGGRAHAIGESGLFNSTTACNQVNSCGDAMLARQTFTDVSLSNGDSITITWTFTVGN